MTMSIRKILLLTACIGMMPIHLADAQPPAGGAAHDSPAPTRIVDLTHSFNEQTVYWPTEEDGFQLILGDAGKLFDWFRAGLVSYDRGRRASWRSGTSARRSIAASPTTTRSAA